jgi:lipid-binding SYLF domain-containing protein
VFPSVIAAGFWIGGQYGEGSLRVGGSTIGYYSTTTGSIGLQIGAQSKVIIFQPRIHLPGSVIAKAGQWARMRQWPS